MKNDLIPDYKSASDFLDLLDPACIFTFQTFDDHKVRKDMRLARVFHGELEQFAAELTELQQHGAGVFVMVNQGDGVVHPGNATCRTACNVVHVRALFADLDGSPLDPLLALSTPNIVVESSPKKWHAYYLTNDCPLEEFKLRQQQIAKKFNSDPKVCDLPRVMRVPGFFHQKAAPFMTHVVHSE